MMMRREQWIKYYFLVNENVKENNDGLTPPPPIDEDVEKNNDRLTDIRSFQGS